MRYDVDPGTLSGSNGAPRNRELQLRLSQLIRITRIRGNRARATAAQAPGIAWSLGGRRHILADALWCRRGRAVRLVIALHYRKWNCFLAALKNSLEQIRLKAGAAVEV